MNLSLQAIATHNGCKNGFYWNFRLNNGEESKYGTKAKLFGYNIPSHYRTVIVYNYKNCLLDGIDFIDEQGESLMQFGFRNEDTRQVVNLDSNERLIGVNTKTRPLGH